MVDKHQLAQSNVLLTVPGNLLVCMSGDQQHILAVQQHRVCVLDLSGKIVWEYRRDFNTAWWASNTAVAIGHDCAWQCYDIHSKITKIFPGTSSAIHDNIVLTARYYCNVSSHDFTTFWAFDYTTGKLLAVRHVYSARRVVGVHAVQKNVLG